MTFFDDFHDFCMTLFFYLSSFAPTTYINILGVAKDLLLRFRDADLQEDDWRQS